MNLYLKRVKESNAKLQDRAVTLLSERAYDRIEKTINGYVLENTMLSVYFSVIAAAFYAMMGPFTAWMIIPATAAAITSTVFAGIAYEFSEVKKTVENRESAAEEKRKSEEKSFRTLIESYNKAEKVRQEERAKLNVMKFGIPEGQKENMSYEEFKKGLKNCLSDSHLYDENGQLVTLQYAEKLYNIEKKDSRNLKDLFKEVNPTGREQKSTVEIISAMVSVLNGTQQKKHDELNNRVIEMRRRQQTVAEKYNSAVALNVAGVIENDRTTLYSKAELNVMAEKAWGTKSWSETSYRNRMQAVYNKYTDEKYAGYQRKAEEYIVDAMEEMTAEYSSQLESERQSLLEAKKREQVLIQAQFDGECVAIEKQLLQILAVVSEEWKKAEAKITKSHNEQLKKFEKELKEKRKVWDNSYVEFLREKKSWIHTQYIYAQNTGSLAGFEKVGGDSSKVLRQSLKDLDIAIKEDAEVSRMKDDMENYVGGLYNGVLLDDLMGMTDVINLNAKNAGCKLNQGNKKNLGSINSYIAALKVQGELEEKMKDDAARLAAIKSQVEMLKNG